MGNLYVRDSLFNADRDIQDVHDVLSSRTSSDILHILQQPGYTVKEYSGMFAGVGVKRHAAQLTLGLRCCAAQFCVRPCMIPDVLCC